MHGRGILSALGTHAVHESRLKARGITFPSPLACALAHRTAVSAIARPAAVRGLVYDVGSLAAGVTVGVHARGATTRAGASHHSPFTAACGSGNETASSPVRISICTALPLRPHGFYQAAHAHGAGLGLAPARSFFLPTGSVGRSVGASFRYPRYRPQAVVAGPRLPFSTWA